MSSEMLTTRAVGDLVRAVRRRQGLTQRVLAEQCGVSRKFIGELEAGKDTASLGLTLRVINSLGLDLRVDEKAVADTVGTAGDALTEHTSEDLIEETSGTMDQDEYRRGPDMRFARQIERTLQDRDYSFALRLLGEYAGACLTVGRAELSQAPDIGDDDYLTALAGISRWVARKTATDTPGWASEIRASSHPIFPAERLHPVTERMKELIRSETPTELAGLNVWIRERDLARV